MNNDSMNSINMQPVAAQTIWQRDLPAASDLTFMLATLQRIEQHRFRRSMWRLFVNSGATAMVSWALWPWLSDVLTMLSFTADGLTLMPIAFGVLCSVMILTLLMVWRERR